MLSFGIALAIILVIAAIRTFIEQMRDDLDLAFIVGIGFVVLVYVIATT